MSDFEAMIRLVVGAVLVGGLFFACAIGFFASLYMAFRK